MNRVTMSNLPDPRLNLPNEIIDLTGDSPLGNWAQYRASHDHNSMPVLGTNNNFARDLRIRGTSPIPIHYDPLTSVDMLDNSFIQIVEPDVESEFMARRFGDEDEFRDNNSGKSNEEYSTAVPCINDSCSGQQMVLSCPICFEPLVAEQKPMATSCGHIFCALCLKQTLQRSSSKSCPKCNAPVKIKTCIRLYF